MKLGIKTEPVFTIELPKAEAEAMCVLLGGIQHQKGNANLYWLKDLFYELDVALPGRKASFSDLFDGTVSVK